MRSMIIAAMMCLYGAAFAVCAYGSESARRYKTPEEAVNALVSAAQMPGTKSLEVILGVSSRELLESGDTVQDREGRRVFLKMYRERNLLESRGSETVLLVGEDLWPFPIGLVEDKGSWKFDTAAGKEEINNRRIGANELHAIGVCREYVRAQQEYYTQDRDGDGFNEYATSFLSTRGYKNGLFWVRGPGESPSPLGPLGVRAFAEGYSPRGSDNPQPYHGYYFRILMAQGPHAPGGAMSYVGHGGRLTGGFALAAYPVRWGVSGVMSFLVSQDGRVLERNLGGDTQRIASAMSTYDPGVGWRLVEGYS